MWKRLRTLWWLSGLSYEEARRIPTIHKAAKPEKRLATIVKDSPIDYFPDESDTSERPPTD
jgi:hypothetical protein